MMRDNDRGCNDQCVLSLGDRRRKIASMLAQGAIAATRAADTDQDRPENGDSEQPADDDLIAERP